MDLEQMRYWIALNLMTPVLGSIRTARLIEHFGDAKQVLLAGMEQWQALGLTPCALSALAAPNWPQVEQVLTWAQQPSHHLLSLESPHYPSMLREISDPPVLLYAKGDLALLAKPQLAVVGSRHPTPIGEETALTFATQLAKQGFVITSGLALGIDGAAHRGALACEGMTLAVAGTGIDQVYPRRHADLTEQISQQGLLISEFPLGAPPLGRHFPLRNRIISGFSQGVIVVEAALKSGSLITAKQALEQGREVFAIPGSIHSATSRGCHWLLRQGAKLVENIEDILDELNLVTGSISYNGDTHSASSISVQMDAEFEKVLAAVNYAPTSIDSIIERSGLTADAVCSMLLVLELQDFVHISSAGQYCRAIGT